MAERLRVGILCDSLVFQRWQAECIRAVLAVPGVEPAVLVVNDEPPIAALPWHQRMLRHPWRMALYLWYRKRWFKPAAMDPVDLSNELSTIPLIKCRAQREGAAQRFTREDVARIGGHHPDVLLCFGFGTIKGDLLELPRHGIWSYHHGDEEKYRGQPPGFWEILDGEPVTGAVLQRLTEEPDAGRILRKGWFRTLPYSLEATMNTVLMATSGWAAQVCVEILLGRPEASAGQAGSTIARIRKLPGNITFLAFLWQMLSNRMKGRKDASNGSEEWNIGVLYQPIASLLDNKPSLNVRWLPPPSSGQFRAHPFGYIADGRLNVLYEKFDHGRGRGVITRLRPKRDNVLKRSRTLLDTATHLSYPYVVLHEGQIHVVPQSDASGRVDLYRMNGTNDALEFVSTLVHEPLLSPTVFEHQGRWWIMGTQAPLDDIALYTYHAPVLEGPYVSHPLNPVKMDLRTARPAGTPFVHEGRLYRPAQDSSQTRGWRIALMHITELTTTTFKEEPVKTIGPLKGTAWSQGLHTISSVGELTLVDGKRYVNSNPKGNTSGRHTVSRKRNLVERSVDDDETDDEE